MGSKSGLGSYIPLRGRSGQTVKAWRGKEGYKEAQTLKQKAYGKGTIGAKFRAAKAAATKVAQEKIPQVRALKEHGVQAWSKKGNYVKGNKIVVKDEWAKAAPGGKTISGYKKKTLPVNIGEKGLKSYLGYSHGGLITGKPKLAKKGWK